MTKITSSESEIFDSAYSRILSGNYRESSGLYSRIIQEAETTSWLGCFFSVISWLTGFQSKVSRAVDNAFQLFANKDSAFVKSLSKGLSPYQTYQKWSKHNIELQTSGSTAYSSFIISIRSIFSRNASRLNDSSQLSNNRNSTSTTIIEQNRSSSLADGVEEQLPSFTNVPPSSAQRAHQLITQADLDQIKARAGYNDYLARPPAIRDIDRSSFTPSGVSSNMSPTQSNHSGSSTIDVTQQRSPSISPSSPISKTSSPISRKPADPDVLSELEKIRTLNNISISRMRQYGEEEVVSYETMMDDLENDRLQRDNEFEALSRFRNDIKLEFPVIWNTIILPLGLREMFVDLVYQCQGNMEKLYRRLRSEYEQSLIFLENKSISSNENTLATPESVPLVDEAKAKGMLAGLQRSAVQRAITEPPIVTSKSTIASSPPVVIITVS